MGPDPKPIGAMIPDSENQARLRLDQLLVERGHFETRSRARDAILRGTVTIDGKLASKPGQPVSSNLHVAIHDPAQAYVSWAALKLLHAFDAFGIEAKGAEALDIGASTGGFTQVLLERGAAHVHAIDVGHGQLHPSLREDPGVSSLEGLNARDLTLKHISGKASDLVVSDVSFISLRLAMPPALALVKPGGRCVLLVKPQFEVGRPGIGKGGVVRDPKDGERVAKALADWLDEQPGWRSIGLAPSSIEGADGNREFLLAGLKGRR